MRAQILGFAVLVLISATACSSPPQAASNTAAEIAALEKHAGSPTPARAVQDQNFAKKVTFALHMLTVLPRGVAARQQQQLDTDLAVAKKTVADVRALARTPAEQNVALLLTTVLVKDKERHQTALLAPASRVDMSEEIRQLKEESAACRSELDDWMKAVRGEVDILEVGSCLQRARAVAAFLGQP
jgi:hypothetical protein